MEHVTGLGPVGQVIIIVLVVVLAIANGIQAYFTWRAQQWKTTAEAATTALTVASTERDVWKERGERLSTEKTDLTKAYAALQARTDLQPLVDAINNWTVEGRGRFEAAMARLEVIHSENVTLAAKNATALEQVTKTLASLSERVLGAAAK